MPSSSKPPVCKRCQKPGYAAADGTTQHERRANPSESGGRRKPPTKQEKIVEGEPDREHPLGRKIFGKREE